jgi:hypothetical protein
MLLHQLLISHRRVVIILQRKTWRIGNRLVSLFNGLLQTTYLAYSRTLYKFVPLTNLNNYLYVGKSEIKVSIKNSSEKLLKKYSATIGKLMTAIYASVVYVDISCTCLSSRLEYSS